MRAKAIMIQGTGSDVGKSVIVAGLCRCALRRGINVAPFKPQNMSNNAAVTADGGEIGRAQALQAQASALAPSVHHNPVLLKPQSDTGAQVVVHGQVVEFVEAAAYMGNRDRFMGAVMHSFETLCQRHELVIVEGAGSASEVNLRDRDIANMGFAVHAQVPVVLLGDIDRGGVIASLVGTQLVIDKADAAMIKGFVVNKFRGDITLFKDGVAFIEAQTQWPCFGGIPWLKSVSKLPAEDAVIVQPERGATVRNARVKIVAPMLSRMANFDDADPLIMEPCVDFKWIKPGEIIDRDADVIMLFGSKSTLAEVDFLREQGWDVDIKAHRRAGGRVFGICGGYQLLGQQLFDPEGTDGLKSEAKGLGLLNIDTAMKTTKKLVEVSGVAVDGGAAFAGYEIHQGCSYGEDLKRPLLTISGREEGAQSADGRVAGTYVHGLFASDAYRAQWLKAVSEEAVSVLHYSVTVETALDQLADALEAALDIDALLASATVPVFG